MKLPAAPIAVLLVLAAQPAGACHRYRVWRYPWPQHCSGFAHETRMAYRQHKPLAIGHSHHQPRIVLAQARVPLTHEPPTAYLDPGPPTPAAPWFVYPPLPAPPARHDDAPTPFQTRDIAIDELRRRLAADELRRKMGGQP